MVIRVMKIHIPFISLIPPKKRMKYEWLMNGIRMGNRVRKIHIPFMSLIPQKNAWDISIIRIFALNMNGYPMVIRVMKIYIPFISLIPKQNEWDINGL